MKYEYIFWDLDGTLTDPGIGITNSVMHALGKFGIEVSDRRELYKFIGPPLVESFETFYNFSHEEAWKAVEYYREYFGVIGLFENEVYEGIPKLLSRLKDEGYGLYVATSKPLEFSVRILERFDLLKYFDGVSASSMDERNSDKASIVADALNKSGAKPEKVLMVGDRRHDIIGAHANGVDVLAVLYGYGSREEFAEAGADYIATTVEQIYDILR